LDDENAPADYSLGMSASGLNRGNVLLVDDEAAMGDYLVEGLMGADFRATAVRSGEQALAQIALQDFDVLVTDLRMKGMGGLELCRRVRETTAELPVIVLTAFGDYAAAVEAVRAGAYDFLAKPVKLDVLSLALSRAVERRRLRREVKALEQSRAGQAFGDLVGDSSAMRKVHDLVARIAPAETSVLVTGESGTGKELVARALHVGSPRRAGPFIAINCAALPETLLEGELFGYERGAFTDAKAAKTGLFVQANGGTLFLDEIGELPLGLQAKLLRALQERVVRPLGSNREIPFDVRLVTATNRDLETAVEEKRFREDFYFRINVVELRLPPLRVRGNDILELAAHFLREFAGRGKKPVTAMTAEVGEKLLAYPWPGNVRELSNVIERAVALTHHDHITVQDLPEKVAQHRRSHVVLTDETEFVTLEEMEKRYILQILAAVGGSKSVAARILGLDRTTLWRKLERYQIEGSKPGKS
jgi:DNA-binding NtrC family response regulator